MTETKQDVFEDLLDAYGDAIAGGGQGDNGHPAEYRLRYAAATDGDPQCPYCHRTKHHANEYAKINDRQRITHSNRLGVNILATREPGQPTILQVIHFCPMCGRKLGEMN